MIAHKQQQPSGRHDDVVRAVQAVHQLVEQQVALLDREQRLSWLEAIFNNLPGQLYAKDLYGRYILCNRAMLAFHNLVEEDEIVGKTDFDLYSAEQASENLTIEQNLLRTGKPLLSLEEETVGLDGRDRCLLVSKIPVSDAGIPGGIVGFSYDISDRKDIENLMLGQANMLGMVARSLPLDDIVSRVIVFIEDQMPGAVGSVQLLSPDGRSLTQPIAPHLPDGYGNELAMWPIGPSVRRQARPVRRPGPVRR